MPGVRAGTRPATPLETTTEDPERLRMGSTPNLVHQRDKTCVICGGTTACKSTIGLRSQTAARTSYRTSSSDARRTTNMPPLRAARAPRLTARRKNSVLPLASTLMAWTSEPLACPHCEAQIHAYEDVLTLFLSRVELIVVGCAACRKAFGVLPPAKVDYWPMFGRRRWALRWFPVRRKAFRGADLPGRAGLPGGARGESLPAGTRPQDTA